MTLPDLKKEFHQRYGTDPTDVYYCPGRVNIIGEHIDYNGGRVMPCAIGRGTWVCLSVNDENKFRFQCLNFPETAEFPIQPGYKSTGKEWYNYPLGVIHEMVIKGHQLKGLNMLFYGDIPIGAGLSSSASIEVLTGTALNQLFDLNIGTTDIALIAKSAENNFVGVNCGIMDQFAVAHGKEDHAILLNCDTLDYEYIPFELGTLGLVVINTNKPRKLSESKYNERFDECRKALVILQQELNVNNLCEIPVHQFQLSEGLIVDETIRKRAKHVITENARVKDAVIAMQTRDLVVLGKLMYTSHQSLKEDYEVSCNELDTIVEFSSLHPACMGARMTGAGFGGCAIALVEKDQFEDYAKSLTEHYTATIGYEPEIFLTTATNGAHSL